MNFRLYLIFFFTILLALQNSLAESISLLEKKAKYELAQFSASLLEKDSLHWRADKYSLSDSLKRALENEVRQGFFRSSVHIWRAHAASGMAYCAVLDNAIGKTQPITFLTITDTSGIILFTSVLVYREAYGGAVKGSAWNRQFFGKKTRNAYRVGKDIDGITGATLSVNALAKGYRKAALLGKFICQEKN